MVKRILWSMLVFVLGISACGFGAAAFDSTVLNDTTWYVWAKGSSSWSDEDGRGKDPIADLIFLQLNADGTYEVTEIEDDSGTALFVGTWDCDSKGKITMTVNNESLEEWFVRDNIEEDEGDVLNESSLASEGSFSGTVKRKGEVLTLKIKGQLEVSATYEAVSWDYDEQSGQWQDSQITVNGWSKDKFSMTGLYDLADSNLTERTYRFTEIPLAEKIDKQSSKSALSCDVTLEPENTCFGQFTMEVADGSYGGILTGSYTTLGKKLMLQMGELTGEEMVKESGMNYLQNEIGEEIDMDNYDDDWDVDSEGRGMVLTENTKKQNAKLVGKLDFYVSCWLEGDLEEEGKIVFSGTGDLID